MRTKFRSGNFVLVFTTILFICISFSAKSQCDVTITALGPVTFCEGDSVTLLAHASADTLTLDQSQTLYDGGTSARNLPGYSYWQSFQAGITGTLKQIDVGFFTYINGTCYWTVWDGYGTSGTLLDTQAVNIYCSGGNCLLSFAENLPVTAGNTYTFQVRGGPGMPDPYGIQIGSTNPYANGQMVFVDPSGIYPTDFDMVFSTWVGGDSVSYMWSTGETDSMITVSTAGDYSVTATTTSGCTSTADTEVTVNPLPQVNLTATIDTVCKDSADVLLIGSPAGGVYSGQNVYNDYFMPTSAGSFTLYYSFTDSNGCANTASTLIVVVVCASDEAANNSFPILIVTTLSHGKIVVRTNEELIGAEFTLYNMLGENISRSFLKQEQNIIDVSKNLSGIYLYVMRKENQIISTGKILIEN